MKTLADKVAIVTGASSGIGAATAQRLVQEGAHVIGIARRAERLTGMIPFPCDVTDHAALERCVRETVERFGRIDILVNNAGSSFYERHVDSTLEHWRQTMAVNLEPYYVLAKFVVPHMIQRRYGRIVNVSSIQALASEAVVGAYAATKGAINAWTRSLAVDLAEHGILVNAVAPGFIHTEMSIVNGVDETTAPDFQEWYVRRRKVPLARAGRAEEVANVIRFLSGDQCTYITGHTLVVDGGLTITF